MYKSPFSFRPINTLLDQFLVRFHIKPQVEQAKILSTWKKAAKDFLNPTILKNSKPVSCQNHELLIITAAPIYAQEIHQKSSLIISKMNKLLGYESVKKFRTKLGRINEN